MLQSHCVRAQFCAMVMLELSFIAGVATSVIVYYSVCKVSCSIIVVAGCNIEG